jgi:hypothetical protein
MPDTRDYVNLGDAPVSVDDLRSQNLAKRERRRQVFLDKFERTPRKARRWFRIEDIEPNEAVRAKLVKDWRRSISHGDLMLREKSQVLCLNSLMEDEGSNRVPPNFAHLEFFYEAVGDLWMSSLRWLQWFDQVDIKPPEWLASLPSRSTTTAKDKINSVGAAKRKTGARPHKVESVKAAMSQDILDGVITKEYLTNALEKELLAKYGSLARSRDTIRKARDAFLAEVGLRHTAARRAEVLAQERGAAALQDDQT